MSNFLYSTKVFITISSSLVLLMILFGCGGGSVTVESAGGSSTPTGAVSPGGTFSTGGTPAAAGPSAGAGRVVLSWDMPTLYSDDSPIAEGDLQGYRIYYGTTPIDFNAWHAQRINGTYYFVAYPTTSVDISALQPSPGIYYFAVTALDTTGMESDFLIETSVVIN